MSDEVALHYIVNDGAPYDGPPDLDAVTGKLMLPHGESLDAGARDGWKKIVVLPGAPSKARKKLTEERARNRRRRTGA
jgi:hypothetical protein